MRKFTIMLALALVVFGFSYITAQVPATTPDFDRFGPTQIETALDTLYFPALKYSKGGSYRYAEVIGLRMMSESPFRYYVLNAGITTAPAAQVPVDTTAASRPNFAIAWPCVEFFWGGVDSLFITPSGSDTVFVTPLYRDIE